MAMRDARSSIWQLWITFIHMLDCHVYSLPQISIIRIHIADIASSILIIVVIVYKEVPDMKVRDLAMVFDFSDTDYKIVEQGEYSRTTLVDSSKPGFWMFLDDQNEYKKYLDRDIIRIYPRRSDELKILVMPE